MTTTSLILTACLVIGVPLGVCRAEVAGGATLGDFPRLPPAWATPAWIEYAAHVVASEARNVPAADIVIACTILRDVERGWHPWSLHPGRWHGFGRPDKADRQAVHDALLTDACDSVPNYRYVGNFNDAKYWRRTGVIGETAVDLYLGPSGSAVVGVR